jgi:hypothetical protein
VEGAFDLRVALQNLKKGMIGNPIQGLKDLAEIAHRLVVVNAENEMDLIHVPSLFFKNVKTKFNTKTRRRKVQSEFKPVFQTLFMPFFVA